MELRKHANRFARWGAAVAAALVVAAVVMPARAQDGVAIPGTSVTLTPPPGFKISGRGLDNGSGSTITVSERSAQDYDEMAAIFSSAKNLSAAYADQGVTARAVRRIGAPAGEVLFATAAQSFRGRNTVKYYALFKGDRTVLLSFTLADRSFSERDAEALVRSVSLAPAPTVEEQLSGLSFKFTLVEPFRLVRVQGRNTVTLASGPEDAPDGSQPVVVIGRGQSQAVMGDEARIAVELLKNTAGFREATITAQSATPFAGGQGFVVTAAVGDRTVIQYLRIVPGGAYLRFLARGPTPAIQAAEAAIAELAASVEPS